MSSSGLSLPRRLRIVVRWPAGIARATWEYLTRRTPVHRTVTGGDRSDLPEPAPPGSGLQEARDGVGTLLHRLYRVTVDGAEVAPETLIAGFTERPNRDVPAYVATFVKTRGGGTCTVGDEFLIRMPGPWDGPVRVVELAPGSLLLATLPGHLEAGLIAFRARREAAATVLEIESWARPGDRVSHLLYNRVRLAREIQLNLWVETLLRLARRSGGRVRDGVHVITRIVG